MRQEGEASVEEILESIKKVIARDNRASAALERRKREEGGIARQAEESLIASQDDEILDLGTADFVEEAEQTEHLDGDGLAASDGPLTTDAARNSMRENLAALAMLAEPGTPPQIVRSGETSLEGLVREMLRPMLAEWLDANLPDMVEKMVRDEISRIAGKRG